MNHVSTIKVLFFRIGLKVVFFAHFLLVYIYFLPQAIYLGIYLLALNSLTVKT